MQTKLKRGISVLLSLALMTIMLLPITASAETVDSGSWGDNLTWTLDSDGTFSISGNGDMSARDTAWYRDSLRARIKKVVISDTVTSIGDYAFDYCTELTSVTVPNSVTSIGVGAFSNCYDLKNITMPNYTRSIGARAFAYCISLTGFNIPMGVARISEDTFYGCRGMTNISIPNSVESIGRYAFADCIGLTNISIPDKVQTIGICAFMGCINLKNISIPDSTTFIGEAAFDLCDSLTNVIIPANVSFIGEGAFSNCSSLTEINVDKDNKNYKSVDGVLFNNDMTTLELCPCGKSGEYEIPDGVITIQSGSFEWSLLTSITIPESVAIIRDQPFDPIHLRNISVDSDNENFMSVDGVLFDKDMTELIFVPYRDSGEYRVPEGVQSIGRFAFSVSGIYINIPRSVSYIDEEAFRWDENLMEINVDENNEYYSSIDGVLFDKDQTELIHFPEGRSGEYSVPFGVTSIGNYAFADCVLAGIDIPIGVTNIGESAFLECYNLASISMPEGIETIPSWAFMSCSSLKKITIPNSVTYIWDSAFCDCTALESINIPSSIEWIDQDAFDGCENLKNIILSTGINIINSDTFSSIVGLSISDIIIPNTVTYIEDGSLADCSADIYYLGTEEEWNALEYDYSNGDIHFNGMTETVGDAIVVREDGETGATGFTAALENIKGSETTASDILWRITSNGESKEFEVELPSVVTLENGAGAVIGLVVNGLYDEQATAKAIVK